MITKWKVFNFKSVRNETELEFAPLTIFAGGNSSGKSSFLQSILLVAQTLSHKVSSRSVVLNGALTKLGQFDDLKTGDSDAAQIVIGWTCKPIHDPQMATRGPGLRRVPGFYGRPSYALSSVSCEIGFDTDESGAQRDVTQIQPRLFSSVVSLVMRDPDRSDRPYSVSIRRATAAEMTAKHRWTEAIETTESVTRMSLQYELALDDESLAEIHEDLTSAKTIGCVLRHFLPERIALGVDLIPETARLVINALMGDGPRAIPRRSFMDRDSIVPRAIIDYVLDIAEKAEGSDLRQLIETNFSQPSLFGEAPLTLESFLEALRRLPMRARSLLRRKIVEDPNFESMVNAAIRSEKKEDLDVLLYRPPSAIGEACWYLDQFFATSLRYLGPLRDEPKSLYPLSPTADPSDVGLKGEHTAAVLELHKNRPVRYIPRAIIKKCGNEN